MAPEQSRLSTTDLSALARLGVPRTSLDLPKENTTMTSQETTDPRALSQAELDEYLDRLVDEGKEDTAEFHRAYAVWEDIA